MKKILSQAVIFTGLFLAWFSSHGQTPKQKPDSGYIIYNEPAKSVKIWYPKEYVEVVKLCTVYVCPPVVPEMKWSTYNGTFQSFLDSAARIKQTAYLDKEVIPASTINVPSGTRLVGVDSFGVIRNKHKFLFQLSNAKGRQVFENLTIYQDSIGTAFTRITFGATYYDSLYNVKVIGGIAGYESARGGLPGAVATTAINRCYFDNSYICLSVFSQDGPDRELRLYNTKFLSQRSHNIYVHPSVSLYFDSVASMGAGKLMMHQFSHNGLLKLINKDHKVDGAADYYTARYSIFKRVYCNGKAFEMTPVDSTLNNGYNRIWIEHSDIGPYVSGGAPVATVNAYRTSFFNAGNGILIAGVLDSCSGGAWGVDGHRLTIRRSNMSEVVFRYGGQIFIYNSKVENMWGADRGIKWIVYADKSSIGRLQDFGNGDGYLVLYATSTLSSAYRGSRVVSR